MKLECVQSEGQRQVQYLSHDKLLLTHKLSTGAAHQQFARFFNHKRIHIHV